MKHKQRSPLLSARIDWIVLELMIIFVATVVYSIIIWIDESGTPSQTGLERFKIVVKEAVPFFQFSLIIVLGIFEIVGEAMLRYTTKIQEALARGKTEGLEEGREEIYRAWYADWEKRKAAAAEKGLPFDEPPPPHPNNHSKPNS